MPECACGAQVTKAYERVFKPDDCDRVRTCPECDGVRNGADVRKMRSARAEFDTNAVAEEVTND